MHASHLLRACVPAALTVLVGCSASSSEPDVGLSSDALRALSPTEIVGELHYGQTSAPVAYTENPKYRAFRFQGRAGDNIDAWVRSTSGDARAWLLDEAFLNVVSNDNASAGTLDSHLVTTLTKGGIYYVAFREVTMEDASFTVSLNGTSGGATCDPEEENCGTPSPVGPFEETCAGPAMTSTEAVTHFQPGTSTANLGQFTIAEHHRTCNPVTGCGAWSGPSNLGSGQVVLQVRDGKIIPYLAANAVSTCDGGFPNKGSSCTAINGSDTRCDSYGVGTRMVSIEGIASSECHAAYLAPAGSYVPAQGHGGGYNGFGGSINGHCLRLTTTGTGAYDYRTKTTEEYEAVLLSRY